MKPIPRKNKPVELSWSLSMSYRSVILIPARLQAARLPGKPLADIHGKPMIVHVADRARSAQIGLVVVATDDENIVKIVEDHGHKAILTASTHQSGSDRIYEALQKIDPDGQFDTIVNVQGDLPTIAPDVIARALEPLQEAAVDMATLCTEIVEEEEKTNPNIVKLVGSPLGDNRLRALYFTRATAPYGEGPLYHHIGLYVYRRAALRRFIDLPPSPLEQREKLEQLRALEAGMRIDAAIVDTVPLGVDTPQQLEQARLMLAP